MSSACPEHNRFVQQDEKICFIMDESNVLDSSFLERMNTLLANGEVPGLFEGDEYSTLMTQCKEGAVREGLMLDSAEELYKWFTQQVGQVDGNGFFLKSRCFRLPETNLPQSQTGLENKPMKLKWFKN